MIPKIIHYCWFGRSEMPELVQKCIKSWRKYLPDYELKLWNEDNFDVNSVPWTKDAYSAKKWAFVADYVRLKVLYDEGGIYLDTDIEMKKGFDDLLNQNAFIGFERNEILSAGVIASCANNSLFLDLLKYYDQEFTIEKIINNNIANVLAITEFFEFLGLKRDNSEQSVGGVHIYPKTYFNPRDYWGNWDLSKNTYCIHWYMGSWLPEEQQKILDRKRKPFWMFVRKIYMRLKENILITYIRKILSKKGII